jgi:Tol biopolymer transport system component
VTVTTPPRAPETGRDRELEQRVAELEALMEEARRRARRRRQRNLVLALAAILAGLWLYSFLDNGRAGSDTDVAPGTPHVGASPPKAALPQELSFSANGSVVLLRRDGRRLPFLSGIFQPRAERQRHLYSAIDWSPDGSKLLALRWGYGVRALDVTDETGKVVWTVDPHAFDGRWSPDGTRIAFVHDEPGLGQVLFVASSDGRVLTRIAAHVQTFGRAFSWSPDGTKLAYASQGAPYTPQGGHGLVIADATGRRAPRPLPIATGLGSPRQFLTNVQWSPDGSLIAFSSRDDTGPHLDVVHPDGSSLHRVVADGFGYEFDWSPNGKRLAILGPGADVSVVNADGTDLRRIARCRCDLSGRFNPLASPSVSWSLDGTRIAYVSGRGNTVSTIRADGTGATVVATQSVGGVPGYLYPSSLLWRPTRAH